MQDNNLLENSIQPFIKLAQSNMELVKNLTQLPPLAAPTAENGQNQNPFLQGGAAANLLQSNAFLQLMQGAVKNYTEFVMALGQNSVSAVSQTQASLVREGRSLADNVADASEARRRRATQEA